MTGKQIRLFLVDGTAGGLTTAEITNWTGHVLTAKREEVGDLLRREEVARTGVYLLLGEDAEATGGTRCYVGETDSIADRLRQHVRDKDWWDRIVVITSKDENLTKSHVRYLESRLIRLTAEAGRVDLANGTAPPEPRLPEADRSDMDYFVSQLQIILPVLGVNAIRTRPVPNIPGEAAPSDASPVFHLLNARSGTDARAQVIDGEFTLLAGSRVVAAWTATGNADSTRRAYDGYRAQHQRLLADGAILLSNGVAVTARDIVFGSPSTAGAVSIGRSCNGRISWLTADGTQYGAWEARGVE